MPLGDILATRQVQMTRQQIADFMLQEDRDYRMAIQRGRIVDAHKHQTELTKLEAALQLV